MPSKLSATIRFWAKVKFHDNGSCEQPCRYCETGCWIWLGAKTYGGCTTKARKSPYGNFRMVVDGVEKTLKAHHAAWLLLCGPLPPDKPTLDHLEDRCCSTLCVRISHLEPVSRSENTARGNRARNRKVNQWGQLKDALDLLAQKRLDTGLKLVAGGKANGQEPEQEAEAAAGAQGEGSQEDSRRQAGAESGGSGETGDRGA